MKNPIVINSNLIVQGKPLSEQKIQNSIKFPSGEILDIETETDKEGNSVCAADVDVAGEINIEVTPVSIPEISLSLKILSTEPEPEPEPPIDWSKRYIEHDGHSVPNSTTNKINVWLKDRQEDVIVRPFSFDTGFLNEGMTVTPNQSKVIFTAETLQGVDGYIILDPDYPKDLKATDLIWSPWSVPLFIKRNVFNPQYGYIRPLKDTEVNAYEASIKEYKTDNTNKPGVILLENVDSKIGNYPSDDKTGRLLCNIFPTYILPTATEFEFSGTINIKATSNMLQYSTESKITCVVTIGDKEFTETKDIKYPSGFVFSIPRDTYAKNPIPIQVKVYSDTATGLDIFVAKVSITGTIWSNTVSGEECPIGIETYLSSYPKDKLMYTMWGNIKNNVLQGGIGIYGKKNNNTFSYGEASNGKSVVVVNDKGEKITTETKKIGMEGQVDGRFSVSLPPDFTNGKDFVRLYVEEAYFDGCLDFNKTWASGMAFVVDDEPEYDYIYTGNMLENTPYIGDTFQVLTKLKVDSEGMSGVSKWYPSMLLPLPDGTKNEYVQRFGSNSADSTFTDLVFTAENKEGDKIDLEYGELAELKPDEYVLIRFSCKRVPEVKPDIVVWYSSSSKTSVGYTTTTNLIPYNVE